MPEADTTEETPPNPAWAATSVFIDQWAAAFCAVVGTLSDVPRGKEATVEMKSGGKYKYKYSDLGDAMQIIRPALAAEGLVVTQSVATEDRKVKVWTTLMHRSGQFVTYVPIDMAAGDTPQTAGSAITYARRYSVKAALGLADDDDDGAAASDATRAPARADAPSGPELITPENAAKARERQVELGLSDTDVEAIVLAATDGRTNKLEELYRGDQVTAASRAFGQRAKELEDASAADQAHEDAEKGEDVPTDRTGDEGPYG